MATKIETQTTPKMLKDFLQDNNNSSSSTGFKSYPRITNTTRPEYYQASVISTLPRSRSKSRAAAEALGKLLNNAVKSFHSSSTPLTLQRSVSRRFLGLGMNMRKLYNNNKKKKEKLKCYNDSEVMNGNKIVVVSVKVKDILRWRSFRDLVSDNHDHDDDHNVNDGVCEEVDESEPLDLNVGSIDEEVLLNKNSEEFTVSVSEEKLPCWSDEVVVASDADVGPKKDNENMASEEELEQQSPVSVLESPFRDEISDFVSDEEFHSSFDQSLANMERTKQRLLQSIQLFESLAGVHDDEYEFEEEEEEVDEEDREDDNGNEAQNKGYLSRGLCWFRRGCKGLEEKIECIKGMDEQSLWGKFEDERVELGVELEVRVLSDLLEEVLIDFCV